MGRNRFAQIIVFTFFLFFFTSKSGQMLTQITNLEAIQGPLWVRPRPTLRNPEDSTRYFKRALSQSQFQPSPTEDHAQGLRPGAGLGYVKALALGAKCVLEV